VILPAWYYFCVAIGKELKMITGYGDGFFRPDRNISRAEAAAVLLRQSGIEISKAPEKAFLDVPDYAWYKDYVYTAVQIGLIKEHTGYVFPDEEITRGEFAFMGLGVADLKDCHLRDSDGDGIPDYWEVTNNMDPLQAADAATDVDFDGLTALDEFRRGTNPNNPDTDNDTLPDGKEVAMGTNPLNEDTDGDGLKDAEDPEPLVPAKPPQRPLEEQPPIAGVCPCIDNPNTNDTDGDGILDVCDDDIDSDGVTNLLCIFDNNGLVDQGKVKASDDNCVFIVNPQQEDSDKNGVGDACEEHDLCATVPEDMDGVQDQDGCPEADDQIPADEVPGVYVNPGPDCNFIDYESDLVKGDKIMTAITDVDTHTTILAPSNEVTYTPNPTPQAP